MGRKIVSTEIREYNHNRDQIIETLEQKNKLQEDLIASQDELIKELKAELQALRETLQLVSTIQKSEKKAEK